MLGASSSYQNDYGQKPSAASDWLGWLRPSNRDHNGYMGSSKPAPQVDAAPGPNVHPEETMQTLSSLNASSSKVEPNGSIQSSRDEAIAPQMSTASWFNMWPPSVLNRPGDDGVKDLPQAPAQSVAPATEMPMKNDSAEPAAGSTWAFWSRDLGRSNVKENKTEETGELAIVGESSQDHPTPARAEASTDTKEVLGKQNKRGRLISSDIQEPAQKIMDRDLEGKKT